MSKPEMKVIGKRTSSANGLEAADKLLKLAIELRGDKLFSPKGVYKFRSFEEKEAWEWEMRIR